MEVHPHLQSARVELAFDDERELRAFVEEAESQGAFLLALTEAPTPFAPYTIALRLEPGFESSLEATVVQLFEAADTPAGVASAAFQIAPLSRGWKLEFERKLRRIATPTSDRTEMTGVAPIVGIRRMNVREKMHLATKADRGERTVLVRDPSPQVLMGLITNPRLAAEDILAIIRNPQVSTGVLDRLTKERRWMANSEVQKALVRNPKTPPAIALRLMESLPTEELRKLAKIQSGLRENLRKAALTTYLKRSRR